MARITTPVPGYNGQGPGNLQFQDGVAESDDPAIIAYCQSAGYGVDGEPPEREAPEPPDPRDVTTTVVGAPVRDAAVDPRPEDFRPPVNAGEANPHGPEVYAPGLPGGGQPVAPVSAPAEAPTAQASPGRPPQNEPVAAWREYALGQAQDSDEAAEVEKMTKAELIKKYGG
ncbi:hypothetical protein OG384_14945 [Streptomyces sp. NBC_01324]|uniref:hypothetical protein n=1 Tax=Streptomyces sp. NBC_01324 TaxID=2903826 RepID=UPI002E0D3F4D|nr:hypothetical protein OG384_14945 [Streptomyces sp. NBC_01324]